MADNNALIASLLLGQKQRESPLDIYRKFGGQQIAAGSSTAPLGSGNPLEGIARALQGGIGGLVQGYGIGKQEEQDASTLAGLSKAATEKTTEGIANALSGIKGNAAMLVPIFGQILQSRLDQNMARDNAAPNLGPLGIGSAPVAVSSAAPMPQGGGYQQTLSGAESSNNPQAVNPQSGAGGLFQFIPSTWAETRRANPGLNLPETVGQATEAQQKAAEEAFRNTNAMALNNAGLQPTPANLYIAHRAGAQGAQAILRAAPETPMASIVPAQWLEQNPDMRTTAGQFVAQAGQRFGGGATPAQSGGPVSPGTIAAPPAQGAGPTPTMQGPPVAANTSPAGDPYRRVAEAYAAQGDTVKATAFAQKALDADSEWAKTVGVKNIEQAGEAQRHTRDIQEKKDNPVYTQEQNLAHTYTTRLNNAIPQLEALIQDPSKIPSWSEQLQANSPNFPEVMVSPNAKEFRRVVKDVMSATLRRESGASISPAEYTTEAEKFIPQPGDPANVVANKLSALRQAARSIAEGTGRPVTSYSVLGGQPAAGSGATAPVAPAAPAAPTVTPPSPAIDRLKANPGEAAQFDEIFGPGAAARVLGR